MTCSRRPSSVVSTLPSRRVSHNQATKDSGGRTAASVLGWAIAVPEAGPFGHQIEQAGRRAPRGIDAGFPVTDGLLAHAQLLCQRLLGEAKDAPQLAHLVGIPAGASLPCHSSLYTVPCKRLCRRWSRIVQQWPQTIAAGWLGKRRMN